MFYLLPMPPLRIFSLPANFSWNDQTGTLFFSLIRCENRTVLVDAGYEGFLPLIEKAARQQQIDLGSLTDIIISHHDIDHVGGLQEIKKAFPNISIHASAIEAPFIEGREKAPRLVQAESLFPALPEEHKSWALGFQRQLAAIQPVPVDHILQPGPLSWLPPLQVIHTPGHTPGHISLYDPESQTLIAADAVVIEEGHLNIANPNFTLNLPQAAASVKLLSQFPLKRLICFHGGEMTGDIANEFDRLLAQYPADSPVL